MTSTAFIFALVGLLLLLGAGLYLLARELSNSGWFQSLCPSPESNPTDHPELTD